MPYKSMADEMHKFKAGEMHSGKGGPVVKSRKQAIAIGLSEMRRAGEKVPLPKKHLLRGHGGRVEKA